MRTKRNYCLAIFLPLILSCTSLVAAEPEQTEEQITDNTQQGKLIWADLYTGDIESSLNFYTETFGWTIKKFGKNNKNYYLLFNGDKAIAGVLDRSAERNKTDKALWVGSISTNNVQKSANRAAKNNATIILEPHDFALYGKRAIIADPQGAIIAFLDLNANDNAYSKISDLWNWAQLFSINTEKSASFYQQTFNYTVEKVAKSQDSYYLSKQDEVKATIVKLPSSFEQRDRWVNFVDVQNLTHILAKATKNGATMIYQSEDNQLAIIADPNGAFLGLTEQESE
jgi:predicted enzyme related to lactoylglutathione lyase